jgi:hypothetical protein
MREVNGSKPLFDLSYECGLGMIPKRFPDFFWVGVFIRGGEFSDYCCFARIGPSPRHQRFSIADMSSHIWNGVSKPIRRVFTTYGVFTRLEFSSQVDLSKCSEPFVTGPGGFECSRQYFIM